MSINLATLPPLLEVPGDLAQLDNSQLRAELSRYLQVTADSLQRLAWVVRLLEERGEDLSDLRIGLLDYLRRIAYGQVVPELVVRYAESPALMRILASLPLPDQRPIAAGQPVMMVVRSQDGKFDRRMVEPLQLSRDQLSLVFGKGKIRDEAEQILILEDRGPKPLAKASSIRRGSVVADRKRGGLMVGRKFLPTGDVVSALGDLHDTDASDDSPNDKTVVVSLTEAEHNALKTAALRSGHSMNVLARRALIAAGLLASE